MEADWKPIIQKQADDLLDKLKELNVNQKWIANGNKPCEMYKMEFESRVATKGIAIIQYSFEDVLKFFSDSTVSQKINQMMIKMEILHQQEGDNPYRVVYMEYKGQWPIANRDFVIVSIRKQDGDKFFISTKTTYSHPHPEVKGNVRGELIIGGYIIEKVDDKSTKVTFITCSDPKGNIPGMLKNTVAVKQGSVAAKIGQVMKKQGF